MKVEERATGRVGERKRERDVGRERESSKEKSTTNLDLARDRQIRRKT